MIFIEKMKNLKIYKTKTFLPTLLGNKKKGSAVLLMTPNFESSKRLMNNEMFVNSNRYSSYYLERDVSYYINSNVVEEVDESAVISEQAETEEFFLETKRSELPDSEFGVPEERKFPLDTEAHVRSAIRFFNYVEPKYEAELARRIIAKMKKFNITDIHVSEKNRFSKYYHPKKEAAVKESAEDKHVKKCKFCGSEDILVRIEGEPIYICKQCGKFLGVVPFREDSELVKSDIVEAVSEISTGENLMFINESSVQDKKLKQMLFRDRIKNRKAVLQILNQVKIEIPWIKYAFPELSKYIKRNVFVDLYYYNALFFQNNNWVMNKGLDLYLQFMERLLNHPNLKAAGYDKKTIFVPVEDWNRTHDGFIWNFRKNINPISCLYELMYRENMSGIRKVFGDTDIVFASKACYFKINFSQIDAKEIKKLANKLKIFCIKICQNEDFEAEDIDTSADNAESPEVLQAKIADKIENKTGVDLTPNIHQANIEKQIINKYHAEVEKNNISKTNKDAVKLTNNSTNTTLRNIKSTPVVDKSITVQTAEVKKKAEEKKQAEIKTKIKKQLAQLDQEIDDEIDIPADETEDEAEKKAMLDKLANAVVDSTEDSTDEDEALDKMDSDEVKAIYLSLGDDDQVDISASRASRMSKMEEEVLDKEINGRSIRDILSEENKETKEEKTTVAVDSPNSDEWKDLSFVNMDKHYDIDRDIVAIFKSFAKTSRPMVIKDIKVTDNSTAEDRVALYDVQLEDYKGRRYRVKLDIPIMVDNRFLLRGNYKSIQCQFLNTPILKVGLDSCHMLSNYSKIIMERMNDTGGRSLPATSKFMKAVSKYAGNKLKFISGNNYKICAKYHLPIDYIDISNNLSRIESKSWIIYFNQDEIREKYVVDETLGIPFLYNKKTNAVEYFKFDSPYSTFIGVLVQTLEEECPEFGDLYATVTRASAASYTRCHIMSQYIPTVLICAYHVGLTDTLKRAGINYFTETKLSGEIRHDPRYDWIEFDDGYLIYEVTYDSSLLMSGLKLRTCATETYKLSDIDNRNMYLDFLDSYGGRIIADGLDNFKDLFVDPMTEQSLKYYKLPTDYIDILLYGSSLLSDNKFVKHTDATSKKLRRYQLISVYTYMVLAKAYGRYLREDKHTNHPTLQIKQSDVIDAFLTDNITSDDSCINALRDVETTNAVTTKGPSGMNSDRAYSLDKRGYDDTMINVLGMSTGFASNAGITRQTTINADITSDGYVRDTKGKEMNDANTLTATESLIPFGSTRDDPMRTAMSFIQTSKHMVRTEDSDPLLVTNGSDEVMPYLTTDKFAYKAKNDGKIIGFNEQTHILIEYVDGKKDYINLEETIEKNSDGGYYVPLKLTPADGIKLNARVKKNQVVAYDKYSFSNKLGEGNNLAYNIGKLAKIAILNTDEGFEDAGIISASMAEKLATRVDIKYDCVINKDSRLYSIVKVGDHVEASDDLVIWEDAFDDQDSEDIMKAITKDKDFSELGKRKLKSDVTGTVTGIKIYRTVELDELSPSLHKIVSAYEKPLKEKAKYLEEMNIPYAKSKVDSHYKLNPTGTMKRAQEAILIEVYVEYLDTVGVGDKIVYNSANKAVEKGIFPKGKEPYTAFRPNEKIDAFVADTSISKRIVTSTYVYGAIQKAMIELDRSVKDIMGIPYDDSTV